jgi:hypothetical protein
MTRLFFCIQDVAFCELPHHRHRNKNVAEQIDRPRKSEGGRRFNSRQFHRVAFFLPKCRYGLEKMGWQADRNKRY